MGLSLEEAIAKIFPKVQYSFDPAILYAHSADVSQYEQLPRVVVRPTDKQQVIDVVKYASAEKIPLVARGNGSGAAGGAVPVQGCILIDFTLMNKILDVNLTNLTVRVQPGVVHADLNNYLKKEKVLFPVVPGSSEMATIGGMIGNSASGLKAVKYGTTKDWVVDLQVVFPNGEMTWLTRPVRKSATGLDLVRLMVGSEGTLCLVVEALLRVAPIPLHRRIMQASFKSLEDLGNSVSAVFRNGLIPSAMEVLDKSAIEAIRLYKESVNLSPDAEAILLLEEEGDELGYIQFRLNKFQQVCLENGAYNMHISQSEKENTQLWEARSLVGASSSLVRSGYNRIYIGEDITVPIDKLVEMFKILRDLGKRYDLPIVVFGHIGDGNIHPAITVRKREPEDLAKADKLQDEIHHAALNLKGSVSGEHGVGLARKKYLPEERGYAVEIMRKIKRAIDPDNIFNPSKVY